MGRTLFTTAAYGTTAAKAFEFAQTEAVRIYREDHIDACEDDLAYSGLINTALDFAMVPRDVLRKARKIAIARTRTSKPPIHLVAECILDTGYDIDDDCAHGFKVAAGKYYFVGWGMC